MDRFVATNSGAATNGSKLYMTITLGGYVVKTAEHISYLGNIPQVDSVLAASDRKCAEQTGENAYRFGSLRCPTVGGSELVLKGRNLGSSSTFYLTQVCIS